MCFDFDARPPALPADLQFAPIAGGAGAELIELTSADGTRFSGALGPKMIPLRFMKRSFEQPTPNPLPAGRGQRLGRGRD